jgi:hypothetical protein
MPTFRLPGRRRRRVSVALMDLKRRIPLLRWSMLRMAVGSRTYCGYGALRIVRAAPAAKVYSVKPRMGPDWPAPSGSMRPRVGPRPDFAERVNADQRVDLRRSHRRVAQQLLNDTDVRPAVEQMGRKRMPQRVW